MPHKSASQKNKILILMISGNTGALIYQANSAIDGESLSFSFVTSPQISCSYSRVGRMRFWILSLKPYIRLQHNCTIMSLKMNLNSRLGQRRGRHDQQQGKA
jgi:hypothetical protein